MRSSGPGLPCARPAPESRSLRLPRSSHAADGGYEGVGRVRRVGSGGKNPGVADGHRSRLTIVALSVLVVTVLAGAVIAAVSLTRTMLGGKARNAAAVQAEHVRDRPKITIVSLTFDDAYEDQWRYAV